MQRWPTDGRFVLLCPGGTPSEYCNWLHGIDGLAFNVALIDCLRGLCLIAVLYCYNAKFKQFCMQLGQCTFDLLSFEGTSSGSFILLFVNWAKFALIDNNLIGLVSLQRVETTFQRRMNSSDHYATPIFASDAPLSFSCPIRVIMELRNSRILSPSTIC